jgi:hypothetical protein
LTAAAGAAISSPMDDNTKVGDLKLHIIQELMKVAFFDPQEICDADGKVLSLRQMSEDARAAIKTVRVRQGSNGAQLINYTFADKLAALKVLMRHLGMEIDGAVGDGVAVKDKMNKVELARRLAYLLRDAAETVDPAAEPPH